MYNRRALLSIGSRRDVLSTLLYVVDLAVEAWEGEQGGTMPVGSFTAVNELVVECCDELATRDRLLDDKNTNF